MPSVVFLRAANVGKHNRFRPALLARKLARFDVVNIGAVGTFLVREAIRETALRAALVREVPFQCEIMICPAREISELVAADPFAQQPSRPDIIRFVNVSHKPLRESPPLPFGLPSDNDWLVKIIAIQGRFVLGLYRRHMKAIGYLGKIEKAFGVAATTRNWNTMEKITKILEVERWPNLELRNETKSLPALRLS